MNKATQELDALARSGNLNPYHQELMKVIEPMEQECKALRREVTTLKGQLTKLTNRTKELENG